MGVNERQGVCYMQPRTLEDRLAIARDFVERFDYRIPLVVDPMDNPAEVAYSGWPERLYVIDEEGRVAYKGGRGPVGFRPRQVEQWLETHCRGPQTG